MQLAQEGSVGSHVDSLAVEARAASQAVHQSRGYTWRSCSQAGNPTLIGRGRGILAADVDKIEGGSRAAGFCQVPQVANNTWEEAEQLDSAKCHRWGRTGGSNQSCRPP